MKSERGTQWGATRAATLLAVALLFLPTESAAQAQPDSVKHRNDCRLASQVLTLGQPANRRTWALRILPTCGRTGATAVAEVLRSSRQDRVWRAGLEEVVMMASVLHDAEIFSAALGVANDGSAGKAARIQAFRVLFYQLSPGRADPYESFLAQNHLAYIPPADYPSILVTPVPPDAAERVAEVARRNIDNGAQDPDIVSAARKVLRAARHAMPSGASSRSITFPSASTPAIASTGRRCAASPTARSAASG